MSIQITPIPRLLTLVAPAFTLGTTNAAGAALTAVSSNSTILAYDTTVPASVAGTAVVGDASTAARRNHVHNVADIAATKAQMETATATTVFPTAATTQNHPGVGKVWAKVDQTGTQSIYSSYNVASITDDGVGKTTLNFTTAFSAGHGFTGSVTVPNGVGCINSPATGSVRIDSRSYSGDLQDVDECYSMFMGDQ